MKILVTGSDGQLGKSIRRIVKNGSADKYIFTDIAELDITDEHGVKRFVRENEIDIIVNCAAYTNVDKAESDYDTAELLNATAVGYLAEAIKENDGYLFHISTDYVFGGAQYNTPINEDVAPNPTGVYGITKLHGEEAIMKSNVKALIFRTSWLYSEYGKNFVKTISSLLSSKNDIKVVYDQVGTPTYAGDLANAIVGIIEGRKFEGNEGIYHFSNEGVCSWYDFAVAIKEIKTPTDCKIGPCRSSEFPSPVVRPSYSVLDKSKVKETFELAIPYWRDSLECCGR